MVRNQSIFALIAKNSAEIKTRIYRRVREMAKECNPDLRQHQMDALHALIEIDRIFKENDIRYYLLAGSVLGAVRHQGFIPWDDDIDIGILYKDKQRAYRLLREKLPKPYVWADRYADPSFPRLYGKVLKDHASLIDVFILVKTSNSQLERTLQWGIRKVLFKLYKGKLNYHNYKEAGSLIKTLKVKVARSLSVLFSRDWIERQIEKNEHRFEKKRTDYYLNLYSAYSLEKELIRKEWLLGRHQEMFEGFRFPTVNQPDAYLKHLYGDYRKLPPEQRRKVQHEERFY